MLRGIPGYQLMRNPIAFEKILTGKVLQPSISPESLNVLITLLFNIGFVLLKYVIGLSFFFQEITLGFHLFIYESQEIVITSNK